MKDLQALVQKRFKLSVVLSVAAKLSACILQLVSIPIAINSIGVEGYATFAALFAASLAPQILVLRHGPVLTGPIAALYATAQWKEISIRLWSALGASVATLIISLIFFFTLFFSGLVTPPFASQAVDSSEMVLTLTILSTIHFLVPLILVFEDAQAALHETHLQGMRVTLGNVAAIIALTMALPTNCSLVSYALALVLPPMLVRVANVALILVRHRELRLTRFSRPLFNMLAAARRGILFTTVVGVGSYASNQFPIVAAAYFLTPEETASVAVIQQLTLVAFAFGSVIVIGFLPAFNTSLAAGNKLWVREWLSRIEYAFVWIGVPSIVLFVCSGPALHNYLLSRDLAIPAESILFAGIYATLLIAENYYFLLASSVNLSPKAGMLFVTRAILTGLASLVACVVGYPPMIWLTASILTLSITILHYRKMVWKKVQFDVLSESEVKTISPSANFSGA